MQANNLSDPYRVTPGTRLVIPRYQSSDLRTVEPRPAQSYRPQQTDYRPAPTYRPQPTHARATGPVHVVNPGETLYSLGRRYGLSHSDIAEANGLHDNAGLQVGQHLRIPVDATSTVSRGPTPFSPPPSYRAEAQSDYEPRQVTSHDAPQKAATVSPADEAEQEPRSLGGSPQFRWPVRGRIISSYGPKANGQHNDGINLAVPEGTEVKAAEDGVVAYAGNELKGYGNLVLLRHSDGWMTAYAHNSQLLVKRGDNIRRGQTIARAGQTGGVASPQLHFEIRKGSTPVDPNKYLAAL
jgi:murein DD-endopeptidase MepM/ murein hydrolase activator NlpD